MVIILWDLDIFEWRKELLSFRHVLFIRQAILQEEAGPGAEGRRCGHKRGQRHQWVPWRLRVQVDGLKIPVSESWACKNPIPVNVKIITLFFIENFNLVSLILSKIKFLTQNNLPAEYVKLVYLPQK
jgi:hypothetical protein